MRPAPYTVFRAIAFLALLAPLDIAIRVSESGARLRPLMMLGFATGCVACARRLQEPGRLDPVEWAVASWIAVIWLSVLTSANPLDAAAFGFRYTTFGLLVIAARSVEVSNRRRILEYVLAGTAAAALVGLATVATGTDPFPEAFFTGAPTRLGVVDRLTRPWPHANVAAMALVLSLGLVLASRSRRHALPAALLGLICVTVTYSRGAIISFAVAAIVVVVLSRSGRVLAWFVGAALLIVATMFISPGWSGRGVESDESAWFGADIDRPADLVISGLTTPVSLNVSNEGSRTWEADGPDAVVLTARWIDAKQDVWFEEQWPLPDDLAPGSDVSMTVDVTLGVPSGDYEIWWDLLRANEAYFLQFSGRTATTSASVTSPLAFDTAESVPLVERPIDLRRRQLWTLGWDAFATRPIIGVGPGQAPQAVENRLDESQNWPGGHVHNLGLEVLATTGLAGASALLFLLGSALVGTIRRTAGARRDLDLGLTGSLAAILTHSLFEVPLLFQGTLIPLAIVVGFALDRPDPGNTLDESGQTSLRPT